MKPAFILCLTGLAAVNLTAGYWIGQKSTAFRVQTDPPTAPVSRISAAALDDKLSDSIPMPAGLQGAGLAEILNAAGPLDRFQGIFAHVQNLPIEEIEAEILSVREQMQPGSMDPDRLLAMHLLMTRFGLEQPGRAVDWLSGQDLLIRGFGTATVLSGLASKDPQEAAKLFADPDNPILKMPRVGSFAAIGVAREWSRTDPAGALAWAKSLPEESQGGAYTGIIGGMMAEDPEGATRTAMELPPGRERERLLGNIAENWGTRDPEGALKWAGSLEGMEKSEATKKVLHGWANKDPQAAAAHLATLPAEERDDYTPSVAGRWANRNP